VYRSAIRIINLCLILIFSGSVNAQLTIEITGGAEGAVPIAIVPFVEDQGAEGVSKYVRGIIQADLERTGGFKSLALRDMLSNPVDASQIKFRNWQALAQENLVIGRVERVSAKNYIIEFRLFDVFKQQRLSGLRIPSSKSQLRRTAHKIADIIYQTITGTPGVFSTRIAYVTVAQGKNKSRKYRLQVADADGYNPQTILTSREPIMSPAWSADGSRIAYVSFEKKLSAVYIQTVSSGQRELVASYPGINGAPAWSPDGRQLALTLSKDGEPDIYILDIDSRSLRKLTRSYSIDTEPVWSPDGRSIVFTSDRGGKPQLYSVALDGGTVRRLTFEGSYNAAATLSPDGNLVAMVHRGGQGYQIGVLDRSSGFFRVLTDGGLDEAPSFAPNGSMILYATRKGSQGQLSAVSVDGRVRQRLVLDAGEVQEPAWSP